MTCRRDQSGMTRLEASNRSRRTEGQKLLAKRLRVRPRSPHRGMCEHTRSGVACINRQATLAIVPWMPMMVRTLTT